jgi:hypothetical protein
MRLIRRALVFWLTAAVVAAGITAFEVFVRHPVGPDRGGGVAPFVQATVIFAVLAVPAGLCHAGAVQLFRCVSIGVSAPKSLVASPLSAVSFEMVLYILPAHFKNGVELFVLICVLPFVLSLLVLFIASRLPVRGHVGAA